MRKPTQGQLPSSTKEISFSTTKRNYTIRQKTALRAWIVSAIKAEGKELGEIGITTCSDKELLKINQEHLSHDYYTDIITFDFNVGKVISGDIYISIDRVKENAWNEAVPMQNELCRVIIHGVLHLCGYKDKKPQELAAMRAKEDYYLSLLP